MAIRIIPPKTKSDITIFKKITLKDLGVFLCFFFFASLFLFLKITLIAKIIVFLVINLIGVVMVLDMGEFKPYVFYFLMIKYALRNKKIESYSFNDLDITIKEKTFKYENKHIGVFEIYGIDFGLMTEYRQDQLINILEKLMQKVENGKLIKLDIPIDFTDTISQLESHKEKLAENSLKEIVDNQIVTLSYIHDKKEAKKPVFYLLLFHTEESMLMDELNFCEQYLEQLGLPFKSLKADGIKRFFENFYNTSFDTVGDFAIDGVKETRNYLVINNEKYKVFSIKKLGLYAGNAWLSHIFRIQDAKVIMNFTIKKDKLKVMKNIDRSIVELEARYNDKGITESMKVDLDLQVQGLRNLIEELKIGSQELHEFELFVISKEKEKKKIAEIFKNVGIYIDNLTFQQLSAFKQCLPYDISFKPKGFKKDITTGALAATFPFVSTFFMDDEGQYIGYNENMIFFDIFKNLRERTDNKISRTNANMVILGKPGSGKSYFSKKILLYHRLEKNKIFILDPEDEYKKLVASVGGNIIDVGGVKQGRINPLQVFPSLSADDEEAGTYGHLSLHRQFLESFFKIVIPDLTTELQALLNDNIKLLYEKFKIFDHSDIDKLKTTDFPTLEDLGQVIESNLKKYSKNPYYFDLYQRLLLMIRDFRKGGLNDKLWNGHTTLKTENLLTVFNFQSLFANNNIRIANGQMLLIMRYLMQEVIRNKADNEKNNTENKIIVQIDEAHQFIDPTFPVALKFMYQMVKRIRKYNGSIIVVTQNIKDFIGRGEYLAEASAIVNGCQYTMLFGLAADDLNSTVELYKSYNGGLTKTEQNYIANATQGQCLMLVDSNIRNTLMVDLYPGEENLF